MFLKKYKLVCNLRVLRLNLFEAGHVTAAGPPPPPPPPPPLALKSSTSRKYRASDAESVRGRRPRPPFWIAPDEALSQSLSPPCFRDSLRPGPGEARPGLVIQVFCHCHCSCHGHSSFKVCVLKLNYFEIDRDGNNSGRRQPGNSAVPSTVGRLGVDGFWVGDYGGVVRIGRPVGAR